MMKKTLGLFLLGMLGLSAEKPPNVVVIMADDLGWYDAHFQGNEHLDTPCLDQLAKEGMVFPHGYAAAPVCTRCRRLAQEKGDALPVTWVHREHRYVEKLATPDTSVGDLVGDVDPVKVAEGRTLGDPETVHYGLIPRGGAGAVPGRPGDATARPHRHHPRRLPPHRGIG